MNDNQRTITLVTIPQKVADAIETCREHWSNAEIVSHVGSGTFCGITLQKLRAIPFETLMSALINGYVVEKSAEELEREAHDMIRLHYDLERETEWAFGYCNGIEFTLNTLGIKIEGVNA